MASAKKRRRSRSAPRRQALAHLRGGAAERDVEQPVVQANLTRRRLGGRIESWRKPVACVTTSRCAIAGPAGPGPDGV